MCSRASSTRMCTRSSASRLDSGSSNRNTCGCLTMARPIATRCRWPPDSSFGCRSSSGSSPRMRAARLTCLAISSFGVRGKAQGKAHIVAHGHMRVERIGLEHHGDAALGRIDVVHALAADLEIARRDRLEPGDHPEQRRLSAARRADEDHELLAPDVEIDALDDFERTKRLADAPQPHAAHDRCRSYFTAPSMPSTKRRCSRKKMMRVGRVARIVPTMTTPKSG